jgi:hypothetical protein
MRAGKRAGERAIKRAIEFLSLLAERHIAGQVRGHRGQYEGRRLAERALSLNIASAVA